MSTSEQVRSWLDDIERLAKAHGAPLRLMEVCGTHTMSIFRSGLPSLLPANLQLLSGPGCPVCVTSQSDIDRLLEAAEKDVALCTYGDMLRVPGRSGTLERARAQGADVRVIYSAMDVLRIAREEPKRHVVFAAIGFETTAPATAALILGAQRERLSNLSVLSSHKRVVPALQALLSQHELRLDGIVLPGHVSVVIGANAYRGLPERYALPMVIAGFEDWQLVQVVRHLLLQVAAGEHRLENLYEQAVTAEGNLAAQEMLHTVFEPATTVWRGLGEIEASGFALRPEFAAFDAVQRLKLSTSKSHEHPSCRCGDIITGRAQPPDCALFAFGCTPTHPIGPCMVSSEGTCQAWFKYRRAGQTESVA